MAEGAVVEVTGTKDLTEPEPTMGGIKARGESLTRTRLEEKIEAGVVLQMEYREVEATEPEPVLELNTRETRGVLLKEPGRTQTIRLHPTQK